MFKIPQVPFLVAQREVTLSRTLVNMIKCLITRHLACQYSLTGLVGHRVNTKNRLIGTKTIHVIESE